MERSAIANRVEELINTEDISIKDFAEKVGVQRSSISHILSGRNKPSLDFILNVLRVYPNLNEKWLLYGKGSMKERVIASATQREVANEVESIGSSNSEGTPERTANTATNVSVNTEVDNDKNDGDTNVTEHATKDITLVSSESSEGVTYVTDAKEEAQFDYNRLKTSQLNGNKKTIRQVMVFYSDGTFETYVPGQDSE